MDNNNNFSEFEDDSFANAGGKISEDTAKKVGNDVYYYEEGEEYEPHSDDDSLAVTSLSTGVASLCCCCGCIRYLGLVAAVVAIVTGIIALNKRQNKVMAIIGIITGALSVASWVLSIVFAIMGYSIDIFSALMNSYNY